MSQNVIVNDDLLSAIAIGCPFLETLDISCCHRDVTGVGIKALGFCSSLTSLDISYLYKVDDESIQVLSRNGRLRSLTARACSGLTDSGTSVVEEDLDLNHPYITFCVHDLSQSYLRADTGIILPDPGKVYMTYLRATSEQTQELFFLIQVRFT
ncbi:Hypothetical predicted protein [Mytilus galloprovincialis]|uniref:Uncharacterized protein n=1 Tax=Mytilus galloprovincialis TaxID=29158 RepID=A0A8B6E6V2_MYTGA|nr:Hypothetical predicted protein [Mytilus galloprovincialis]